MSIYEASVVDGYCYHCARPRLEHGDEDLICPRVARHGGDLRGWWPNLDAGRRVEACPDLEEVEGGDGH